VNFMGSGNSLRMRTGRASAVPDDGRKILRRGSGSNFFFFSMALRKYHHRPNRGQKTKRMQCGNMSASLAGFRVWQRLFPTRI